MYEALDIDTNMWKVFSKYQKEIFSMLKEDFTLKNGKKTTPEPSR